MEDPDDESDLDELEKHERRFVHANAYWRSCLKFWGGLMGCVIFSGIVGNVLGVLQVPTAAQSTVAAAVCAFCASYLAFRSASRRAEKLAKELAKFQKPNFTVKNPRIGHRADITVQGRIISFDLVNIGTPSIDMEFQIAVVNISLRHEPFKGGSSVYGEINHDAKYDFSLTFDALPSFPFYVIIKPWSKIPGTDSIHWQRPAMLRCEADKDGLLIPVTIPEAQKILESMKGWKDWPQH